MQRSLAPAVAIRDWAELMIALDHPMGSLSKTDIRVLRAITDRACKRAQWDGLLTHELVCCPGCMRKALSLPETDFCNSVDHLHVRGHIMILDDVDQDGEPCTLLIPMLTDADFGLDHS